MKAAVIEQPGRLIVREIPEPVMGEYDALCQLLYGAVCTGTDQHLVDGTFPWPINYPAVLGHESIGRVIDTGARVRSFKRGDVITRVGTRPVPGVGVCWGGFAEWGVARDHHAMREDGLPRAEWDGSRVNQIVPPGIEPAPATMLITWRETWSYLTRLGVVQGTRLLIVGSGGNGLAFAAHAANLGAERVAVIGSRAREATARGVGATDFYDYTKADLPALLGDHWPNGFDVIVDAVGKQGQIDRVLPLLRHDGVIGIYGLDDWGSYRIDPSCARGTFTYYNGGYDEEEVHAAVVALMEAGKLKARFWLNLDDPYPLDEIDRAFDDLRARKTPKALIKLSDSSGTSSST